MVYVVHEPAPLVCVMDNDQEVVREPFEDNHSREQSDTADSNNACHSRHSIAETDHTDQLYQDGGSSSGDSCPSPRSMAGEMKFAESFGIDLATNNNITTTTKQSRSNPVYDGLLRSNHFESAERVGLAAPMIKTSVTSDCIYHKGTFYQRGDIVALCDQDDGQLYFAQLTGFLQDQYCEKSASVNWLVPHKPTSREFFDPSAYKIGLEDVTLRKLDCMTFVRHCPHDYYIRKFFQSGEEMPTQQGQQHEQSAMINLKEGKIKEKSSYIWTTMKPCRVPQIEACSQSAPLAGAGSHRQHNTTLSSVPQAEVSSKLSE